MSSNKKNNSNSSHKGKPPNSKPKSKGNIANKKISHKGSLTKSSAKKKSKFKFERKHIKMLIPYLGVAWVGNRLSEAWSISNGDFTAFSKNMNKTLLYPIPSFNMVDILVGIAAGVIFFLIRYNKKLNAKKYRHKEEYGSARWGNEKDIEPYIDMEKFSNNIILTKKERLTMENHSKAGPKYNRNKNILVIGGSGSGKTRFFVKPNIMQMHSSYVVTDPKGTVLLEVGKMLQDKGYEIKVFNTINFAKSMHYNPFAYLRKEEDILNLVDTIISNTKGDGNSGGEDFWVKAERLLYCAYIGLIFYEFPDEQKNFNTLINLINSSETREDDETFQNAVDRIFEELEFGSKIPQTDDDGNEIKDDNGNIVYEKDEGGNYLYYKGGEPQPNHFAVSQYHKYKLAAGKTAKSILISCGARLAPFDINALRDIMSYDEMNLHTLGEKKTALFVIVSDTTTTYNFVVAMMYTQLFNQLCTVADDKYNGSLPIPVRCLLDEFANIGQIPNFDKLIATIRSRNISASIILQSQSQLKAIYKDNADTIVGNCDTTLFLGGKEKTTLKELSETLGKQTIDLYNTSENRGQSASYGLNYNKTGRELMSQDELAVMDGGKCILQIRGVRPFFSDKFDITEHTKYKLLSDYNKDNIFDIEGYVERKLNLKNKVKIDEAMTISKDRVAEITSTKQEEN